MRMRPAAIERIKLSNVYHAIIELVAMDIYSRFKRKLVYPTLELHLLGKVLRFLNGILMFKLYVRCLE